MTPADEPARRHLVAARAPLLPASDAEHGHEVGLTDTDLGDLTALTSPGDPLYGPDQPGHHLIQPAILVTGRRPTRPRRHRDI